MLKLLAHSRKTWAVNPHCFNEKSIATSPWVTTQHSPAQRHQPHMPKRSWAKEQAQVCSAKENHGSVVVTDKDVNPSHAYTLWPLRISWNTNCWIHTSSAACFALCPPEEAPALQRGFPEGSGDSINAASEPVKKLLLQVGYSSLRRSHWCLVTDTCTHPGTPSCKVPGMPRGARLSFLMHFRGLNVPAPSRPNRPDYNTALVCAADQGLPVFFAQ